MSTELEIVSKALVDINAVSAGLAALTEQYAGVVYEVTTTKGMAEAKAARLAIREPRFNVESIRKAAKKPILDLGRKLDAEASRITTELLRLENPIDSQIQAEEERKEQERQAKIDAEVKRVAAIQGRIEDMRSIVTGSVGRDSTVIQRHIDDIERAVIDESFEEYQPAAQDAKDASLGRLRQMYAAAVEQEAERARIKAEREELARLRKEADERNAAERARIAEEERKAKEVRDAESARVAAEQRERQKVIDAENARVREANEAAAKIERDRLAAERAELAAAQEALRKAQAPPPAAPTRRGVAVKIPTAAEIVDVLAKHYRARPDTILDWLRSIDFSEADAA